MSTEVAAILERARALARDEQAELAVAIVALLDDVADEPAQVEREWAEELSLRAERQPRANRLDDPGPRSATGCWRGRGDPCPR